jgi:methylmalonyl-CoA/ethylmalonyl-CoA epimerase
MIDRVLQLSIPVRDLDRAKTFYRDVVGLKFLFEVPNMVFFDCGGIRILVGIGDVAPKNAGCSIYFNTPDIKAEVSQLRERGVEMQDAQMIAQLGDREVWLAHFYDPDGNLVSVMCEVSR